MFYDFSFDQKIIQESYQALWVKRQTETRDGIA